MMNAFYHSIRDDFSWGNVELLQNAVEDVLDSRHYSEDTVRRFRDQCEQGVKELDAVVTLVSAVKQDLADTGSTTLDRWQKFKAVATDLFGDGADIDAMIPNDVSRLVERITRQPDECHRVLGHAKSLKRGLEWEVRSDRTRQSLKSGPEQESEDSNASEGE